MPNGRRRWCFTLNNYTNDDIERISNLPTDTVRYLIAGRETGESGTPHLQGFVSFVGQKTLAAAKALIGPTAHLEVCRNADASVEYCRKEDRSPIEVGTYTTKQGKRSDIDAFKEAVRNGMLSLKEIREEHSTVYASSPRFCLEYINDHYPAKVLPAHALRPWQEQLNNVLINAPDDRTIHFVVDVVGNSGKTWFAHHYCNLHPDNTQVIQPGKKADMAFVLDPTIRVLFVDAPRSKQGEFIQYDFLEDVKNGYVFSSKYESRVKQLESCHVVCLMNEHPDMTKLSMDRYNLIVL